MTRPDTRFLRCVATVLAAAVLAAAPLHAEEETPRDVYGAGKIYEGTIDDTIIAAGPEILVDATVTNDVITAGGMLTFDGDYREDLIAAGGQVVVNARVGDDITLAGGHVRVGPNAVAGGTVRVFGGDVGLAGTVTHDVFAAGGSVTLAGTIGGDATIYARHIRLDPGLRIEGKLIYRSGEAVIVPEGAVIVGGIEAETPIISAVGAATGTALGLALIGLWAIMSLIGFLLLAGFLHLAFPRVLWGAAERARRFPWGALGVGAAIMFGVPFIALLFVVTLVGIPVALFLMAAYAALWLASLCVASALLGGWAARLFRRDLSTASSGGSFLWLVLGAAILFIGGQVPILGWVLFWLVAMAAMGGLALAGTPRR